MVARLDWIGTNVVRRRHQAQVRKWPNRRLSPSTAFRPRPCKNSAKFCKRSWSAPLWVDRSGCGFDHGPGVLILELLRTEIAERGVQSACVVDVIDERRKV